MKSYDEVKNLWSHPPVSSNTAFKPDVVCRSTHGVLNHAKQPSLLLTHLLITAM